MAAGAELSSAERFVERLSAEQTFADGVELVDRGGGETLDGLGGERAEAERQLPLQQLSAPARLPFRSAEADVLLGEIALVFILGWIHGS